MTAVQTKINCENVRMFSFFKRSFHSIPVKNKAMFNENYKRFRSFNNL